MISKQRFQSSFWSMQKFMQNKVLHLQCKAPRSLLFIEEDRIETLPNSRCKTFHCLPRSVWSTNEEKLRPKFHSSHIANQVQLSFTWFLHTSSCKQNQRLCKTYSFARKSEAFERNTFGFARSAFTHKIKGDAKLSVLQAKPKVMQNLQFCTQKRSFYLTRQERTFLFILLASREGSQREKSRSKLSQSRWKLFLNLFFNNDLVLYCKYKWSINQFTQVLCLVLIGFLIGNVFGTFMNTIRKYFLWDGLILFAMISSMELINYAVYHNKNRAFLFFVLHPQIIERSFWKFINFFKIGLMVGFFVDAFKVGS